MKITRKFLIPNAYSRPRQPLSEVRGVVIHYVGNPGQTAESVRDYFENLKYQKDDRYSSPENIKKILLYASAHFVVGLDGEIIQCLPCEEVAYHAGASIYQPAAVKSLSAYPNNCTIGIELCHADIDGSFSDITLNSAAELTAWLCHYYDLNVIDDVYRHFDITGKNCPAYFVSHEEEWQLFKLRVKDFFAIQKRRSK